MYNINYYYFKILVKNLVYKELLVQTQFLNIPTIFKNCIQYRFRDLNQHYYYYYILYTYLKTN